MSNTTSPETKKLWQLRDLAQEIIAITDEDRGENYEDAMRIWRRVQAQLDEAEE